MLKKRNIENPKAFQEGYKAYNERKGVFDNPYAKETKMHDLWYYGWRKADRENGN